MTDREELLRKYVRELMRPVEWAMTERVAAILAELGDAMLQHSPTIRVKPEPVAWRDSSGSVWFGPGPGRTPLYEPEDA